MLSGRIRPPLAITVAYVALASLWIWATQWLLGRMGGAHWEISSAGLVFGEIFVLVTGALLYVLVDRLTGTRPGAVEFNEGQPSAPRPWLFALLVALVGMAVIQIFIAAVAARQYAPMLLEKAQRETSNLAAIRAIEIDNWVDERDQGVRAIAQRQSWLREWIDRVEAGEANGFPEELVDGGPAGQFDSVILVDPDRRDRLRSSAPRLELPGMEHFDAAAVSTDIQIVNRFTRGRGGLDLFWILPLFVEEAEVSRGPWYLVFWTRLNTASLIDAAEQGFRVRSESGLSTMLIDLPERSDRGSAFWPMLVLDPAEESTVVSETPSAIVSRLQKGLSATREPADGKSREATPDTGEDFSEGLTRIEGDDRVYASVRLDRLNVQILVLQDRRDVLAPVDELEKWLSLTAILSTLGMLSALLFLWRYLRARYRQGNLDVVRERDFWHQAWLDMPALGLVEIEPHDLHIIFANRQGADWLGHAREHLVGQPFFRLFEPLDSAAIAGQPEAVLPAYFARGAVDHVALEGRMVATPEQGPMQLDLRVLRDSEGHAERMIGMLRPSRGADDRAIRAAIDRLTARCAVLRPVEREQCLEHLADQPDSPFLAVLPFAVGPDRLHDRNGLMQRLERALPAEVRHHRALLRPLADEIGRVLVSREGNWVQGGEPASSARSTDPAGVISAVGHNVIVMPDVSEEADGEVGVRLYITREPGEVTPEVLAAVDRLHRICRSPLARR
ncbi:MAG: PAS domain-containing protein [Pseudomonadota bacterium]